MSGSYYGVIFDSFWTGPTGREIRRRGGKDAQVLALYLAANRHANMLGLYQLLADDVRHETGLSLKSIEKGYHVVDAATFAHFDAVSAFVWVRQMARFRLGLKKGQGLEPNDKRVIAINRIYHAIDTNPFLGDFFDANRKLLCLKKRRDPDSTVVVPFVADHYMSGLQGASEGLLSQRSDLRTEIRDQSTEDQGSEDQVPEIRNQQKAARLSSRPVDETPAENKAVIRALIRHVVSEADPETAYADLKDMAKEACARQHLLYDSEVVGSALDQVLARRGKS